ncbi:MAG: DNA methyltransferase [Chloroflexota bacterium]|nr:hypothetical protein [Anaerolineae bacterium]
MPASSIYARTALDRSEISQAALNIEKKCRSNPLPWRGQFSPQLVQVLLDKYAARNAVVLDPFVGSGTVLLEAGRAGLEAFGTEVNPAAVTLARTYRFVNVPVDVRQSCLDGVSALLLDQLPDALPLFSGFARTLDAESIKATLVDLASTAQWSFQRQLVETLVALLDLDKPGLSTGKVFAAWNRLAELVLGLPFSRRRIEVFHADAREIPLPDSSISLVITSPPYINVFNYHQQRRASMQALHWDLLSVAKSEIGANRKHRSNRFLTVIQFCMDMAGALRELSRVCQSDGRLIFVVGRESNVRGTRFFNGEIVAEVAHRTTGLDLILRQQRAFSNRFGKSIIEDILHFVPSSRLPNVSFLGEARAVARETLVAARKRAPETSRSDIESALDKLDQVSPSSVFRLPEAHKRATYGET